MFIEELAIEVVGRQRGGVAVAAEEHDDRAWVGGDICFAVGDDVEGVAHDERRVPIADDVVGLRDRGTTFCGFDTMSGAHRIDSALPLVGCVDGTGILRMIDSGRCGSGGVGVARAFRGRGVTCGRIRTARQLVVDVGAVIGIEELI
ncbi:hypothetical protein IU428_26140 [Nocardia abscessus]|uniref:hypothetical protein n=1 Tax=Nocardia abscessus TaxID=120957 RepID=UPI001893216A|nr:hypothetical protein [Nocardia abscessus]MBF6475280.1 hypothetical protein [Nocardia abscessus]